MRNFRNWNVWQNGKELVKLIYDVTKKLPNSEKFGLIDQLRRASVSIPTNIAEGAGRRTKADFRNFLFIALGSSYEVETLLDICFELQYIDQAEYDSIHDKVNHIQKQLNSFISKVNTQ